MDRKLKGIPVYVIALMLVAGTVAGATVWFLTVDVPVEYDEPVEINMYSERDYTAQYGGTGADFQLRNSYTHQENANLTYETFHQYVEFDNPNQGKSPLEITVSLEAQNTAGGLTSEMGFVVFDGIVDPVNVTWEHFTDPAGNYWNATYSGTEKRVQRTTETFTVTPAADDTTSVNRTVIYTNRNIDPSLDPYDVTGYTVEWFFEDTTHP